MRSFLIPEVVQASAMDCGPAALHSLLRGFRISSSYGRLREACQTGIDGTSIDTLETAANQLGLEAEQIMVPMDHALLPGTQTLPAIAITRLPSGATHFVVLWRRHGKTVQLMDPAVGRRWVNERQLRSELYNHQVAVPAADWLEFALSTDFRAGLSHRLTQLGLADKRLIEEALADGIWQAWATLDAGTRLVARLVESRAVRKGREAAAVLARFCDKPASIPLQFWTAREDPDDLGQLLIRGAVLVRVLRKKPDAEIADNLTGELAAVRAARAIHPFLAMARFLRGCGPWHLAALLTAPILISLGLLVEALLFRGLFDIASQLGLAGQRFSAFAALILLSSVLLAFECAAFAGAARLSRLLENQLRIAFLLKLPRLSDRYFQSRLMSDMAERCHAVHKLRHMPDQVRQLLHASCELAATALGVYWLEPATGPLVLAIVAAITVPALTTQSLLTERDLRARTHAGGLTRFYLDAMAGLTAIRAHGAEKTILRQHERLVREWAKAALRLQRTIAYAEAVQTTLLLGLVASLLVFHPLQGAEIGRVLLVVYWALNLPAIGQEIGTLARQIPYYRNVTARLLEPLGAPEQEQSSPAEESYGKAPSIEFCQVRAQASGHVILDEISVRLEAGSHVAIVGPSGAGKSSLAGVLLGWLKASEGQVLVDEKMLNVEQLRLSVAWVDPTVQIWNRSLYSNLQYGSGGDPVAVGQAIDLAMLRKVLEGLPQGMQTTLGESGGLVSGGEGQRVRLARAMARSDAKIVILDEPFRGLDREKRRELLGRARLHWKEATLLCITHDLSETEGFDRVLVMEQGRIVEDGSPDELLARTESRYGQLLDAERKARTELWGAPFWRRIHLHSGRLMEEAPRSREDNRDWEPARNSGGVA